VIKLLILDIDGVLNHEIFYNKRFDEMKNGTYKELEYPLSEIDPISVQKISLICEKTNAKIIISSTWRYGRTIEELQKILEFFGFTGEIIDATPILHGDHIVRGNEILKWIKDNQDLVGKYWDYKNYVILDDDSDMLLWQKDNFILVDRYTGITDNDVEKAIEILNR
jgi:hypothetical protein